MTMMTQHINKQGGFTLIEALVAFLILSVGMLGIASLQAISLRAGYTATLRTVAVIKSEEILERMRSNQTVLAAYTSPAGAGTGTPPVECSDKGGSMVSCTPAQMAPYDIFKWKTDVLELFPTGSTASILVVAPVDATLQPLSSVTIAITWTERDPSSAAATIPMNYTIIQDICGAASC